MHERDQELIDNYTIFDELSGKIPKINNKRVFIKQHARFSLISTEEQTSNKATIYFDIQGQKYGYAILSNLKMKVYGSYCQHGDPFDSLIEDLDKYECSAISIVYPRKQILDRHNPKKFHAIWDSFHFIEPDHKEYFLKNQLIWNTENPCYSIEKNYNDKQLSHIKKGKLLSVHQHQKDQHQVNTEGQFRIYEVVV